ncbi:MAG: Uma2 family endonuclease [Bacteroidota bacterium]
MTGWLAVTRSIGLLIFPKKGQRDKSADAITWREKLSNMGVQVAEKKQENAFLQIVRHEPLVFHSIMTRQQFHEFIQKNEELKIERDKNGYITIHPPMTIQSSFYEGDAFAILRNWSKTNKLGLALSPSMLYVLPDGAENKADGSWIPWEKLNQLTPAQRRHITPIVPDFVMEVRSVSDSLEKLKDKMSKVWIANGVKLAWLIDPLKQQAWIYRQDGSSQEVQGFDHVLSGEDVLSGFELDLKELKA